MTRVALLLLIPLLLSSHPHAADPAPPTDALKKYKTAVDTKVAEELPDLVKLYQHLHANPELSLQEVRSAARMATELKKLGFTVTEKVGGTGVVGVLKNGDGPTILVRADMDALPVKEVTGLPYASKETTRNKDGVEVGIMHACGHDIHMTSFVGTARVLAALKGRWSGTLVFVAQPAEEIGAGMRAMLKDGLLTRFPRPDYCLALHADAQAKVGTVRYSEGLTMANVDSVDILVKGRGGHGSAPHSAIDPIVLAAKLVLDLQTIVSREINPTDPAVVTVGSIHGGTKHNIIPNDVKLQITVRSTSDAVRETILKAIERKAKAVALSANAPEPEVKIQTEEFTPATINDVPLTRKTTTLFRELLGNQNVIERPAIMGGEDFGQLGRQGLPICLYFLGTITESRFEEAKKDPTKPLPSMHSDSFAPSGEESVKHGVTTMSLAVLNLLKQK